MLEIIDWLYWFYADFWSRWQWHYLLIPISSGIVGWATNLIALRMTFYPIEFTGIGLRGLRTYGWSEGKTPALGWQGIIPSRAAEMAGISVDLITTKLIDVEEQFMRLNPKVIAREMEAVMLPLMRRVIDETLSQEVPMWKLFSDKRKENIYRQATESIPYITEDIIKDFKHQITDIFDLKEMAIKQLTNNKRLLNEIFLRVGRKEFKFIEYSGLYFGALFGISQMVLWIYYQAWWQLPIGGLIVGYFTNVLALRLIFWPAKPMQLLGLTLQGLFIMRQREVSKEYAYLVAEKIMTMPNIFEAMFTEKNMPKIREIMERHIHRGVDKTAGFYSSIIKLSTGTQSYENIKHLVTERLAAAVPAHLPVIFDYAKQALAVEPSLRKKMSDLPPEEFANFLRPVFQADEWKLILVGAILGMIAGFMQLPFV